MPKVFLNRAKDQAKKEIDNTKFKCRKNGITYEQLGELCGCTPQNICKAFKNYSFSAIQFLMIKSLSDEIEAEKGG